MVLLMVQEVEKATASNGSCYERLKVRDTQENSVVLYNWNEPFKETLPAVIVANVQAKALNETSNYQIKSYQLDNSVSKLHFLPKPEIDVKK